MAVAILELINIQALAELMSAGWNPSIQAASICMYNILVLTKDSMHVHNMHIMHASFIPFFPVLSSCLNLMYHNYLYRRNLKYVQSFRTSYTAPCDIM